MQNPHDSILDIAIRAALDAALAITQVYNGHFDTETKADGSPITLADKRANETICKQLSGSPWPIISEENKLADYAERKNWEHFWLVDPLDGTKEFIGRNGEFTVNIALIRDGEPVLGVIVAPALNTAWFGAVDIPPHVIHNTNALTNISVDDFPAMLSKHAAQIQVPKTFANKRVAVSRSHLDDKTKALVSKMSDHYQSIEMHPKGSSLKLCDLAAGDAAFYPRFTPCYEWDTAAGHAILRASGGEIFSLETQKPLSYNKRDLHNPSFIAFAHEQDASYFFSQFAF
jgi:3'(2'), 5'-bisphosphate nucleotidase